MDGMIGTQVIDYAHTYLENGEYKVEKRQRKERYIRLTMPWKRKMYSIRQDEEDWFHPVFVIYWHRPSTQVRNAWIIRFGWTCN
jgi:hypothetical protein